MSALVSGVGEPDALAAGAVGSIRNMKLRENHEQRD